MVSIGITVQYVECNSSTAGRATYLYGYISVLVYGYISVHLACARAVGLLQRMYGIKRKSVRLYLLPFVRAAQRHSTHTSAALALAALRQAVWLVHFGCGMTCRAMYPLLSSSHPTDYSLPYASDPDSLPS